MCPVHAGHYIKFGAVFNLNLTPQFARANHPGSPVSAQAGRCGDQGPPECPWAAWLFGIPFFCLARVATGAWRIASGPAHRRDRIGPGHPPKHRDRARCRFRMGLFPAHRENGGPVRPSVSLSTARFRPRYPIATGLVPVPSFARPQTRVPLFFAGLKNR